MMFPYKLNFTLEIWSDNDGGGSYEAYGSISLNIGEYDFNQNVIMWNLQKPSYIEAANGASHFITNDHTFYESEEFAHIGNVTAHGGVWEWDDLGDDDNGSPSGDVFQMKNCLNQDLKKHYPGYGAAYIKITLKLTKL